MTSKVVKATARGQITLPKVWRSRFDTDNYLMKLDKATIVLMPLMLDQGLSEEVIFDADRDNDGQGVDIDTMIKLLKEVKNG